MESKRCTLIEGGVKKTRPFEAPPDQHDLMTVDLWSVQLKPLDVTVGL